MKIPISILCVVFLATASQAQTIIPFAGISFSINTYALSSGFGETETRDLAGLTSGVGF